MSLTQSRITNTSRGIQSSDKSDLFTKPRFVATKFDKFITESPK